MEMDTQRIDDAVLALLLLGLHEGDRVWKSFDWDALGLHHALGHISKPVGSAKSMVLTPQGKNKAQTLDVWQTTLNVHCEAAHVQAGPVA